MIGAPSFALPFDATVQRPDLLAAHLGEARELERLALALADRYDFAPPQVMELKGKGPTPVRILLGRRSEVPLASAETPGHE